MGMVHVYVGNGKGKTTAAIGLSVRFAGNDGKVLFTQFLKDGSSSEIKTLNAMGGVSVYNLKKSFGFSFQMTDQVRSEAILAYHKYFEEIKKLVISEDYGLLILDEVIDACNLGFIEEEELLAFLRTRPERLHVVLTGRNPSEELQSLADYVTEMKKVKHPFDQGISAEKGIEY